jgi:hypothetical protein
LRGTIDGVRANGWTGRPRGEGAHFTGSDEAGRKKRWKRFDDGRDVSADAGATA